MQGFVALQILDIAKGLTYLHEIGIVHGDIKGTNVLISPTVDALVADFGLDTLADSSTITSPIDSGSLRWQSPEVLRGAAHKTFSTDVYSFGMTIYEVKSFYLYFLLSHSLTRIIIDPQWLYSLSWCKSIRNCYSRGD